MTKDLKLKRTRWFPRSINPVRVGYYECSVCGKGHYHHWDGTYWRDSRGGLRLGEFPVWKWRGLAKPPK